MEKWHGQTQYFSNDYMVAANRNEHDWKRADKKSPPA